ncbi:MAG: BrnT family toxin [Chloroflexota bacterium]
MKIAGIFWLRDVVNKLTVKHQVEIYEVEEVFANRPKIRFMEKGHRPGENVYSALGQTDAGRYLNIFFV